MAVSPFDQPMPAPTSALVDVNGNITPPWLAFLRNLWVRTGGSIGQSSNTSGLQQQITAEQQARIQGDTNLGNAITAEGQARIAGDQANANALALEALMRAQQDSLMVPLAYLCSFWSQCSFAFLPTTDPGGGLPWNNNGAMWIGTATGSGDYVQLEASSTQTWLHEDGVLSWLWG